MYIESKMWIFGKVLLAEIIAHTDVLNIVVGEKVHHFEYTGRLI